MGKRKTYIIHMLFVVVLGLFIYSNSIHSPFHFDDASNIVENPIIKDLQYFAEPLNAKAFPSYDTFKNRFIGYFTFALNCRLHGLDVTGYHAVNLAIHIINALLVYWLVLLTFLKVLKGQSVRVSESQSFDTLILGHFDTKFVALFSALLFVSHPIQTQAVTYIVQRFTSLATMFYLLSLVMYVKFRTQNIEHRTQTTDKNSEHRAQNSDKRQKIFSLLSVFWYLGSVLSAVLAMKTKEIAFTLPIIIVLYEFVFFSPKLKIQNPELETLNSKPETPNSYLQTPNSQAKACGYTSRLTPYALRFLYLTPFLLTLLIIPVSYIGADTSAGDLLGDISETARLQTDMSRLDYLFTQFRVIVTYIRLLFLPINQNLDYDYPIYNSFLNPNVFLSFLFLLSIFGFGVYLFYYSKTKQQTSDTQAETCGYASRLTPHVLRFTPYPLRLTAFGIFWFFITLSVESSVIPIEDVIFEHRVYLPSIGLIIAFISAVFCFSPYLSTFNLRPSSFLSRHASRITVLLLAAILIVFSIAAYQRNAVWKDEISLWQDVVGKSPSKPRPHYNIGFAYGKQGLLNEAIHEYSTAIRIKPDYHEAHNNLGVAYGRQKRVREAINEFLAAVKFKYDFPAAHNNLGFEYYKQGWFDKAIYEYLTAIRIKPDFPEAHNNLGIAYGRKGLFDDAIREFHTAIELRPDYQNAYYNLGVTYKNQNYVNEAMKALQYAVYLNPNDSDARYELEMVSKNPDN
ncbi:MAG: tetratricopeptide repeat protein [Nitrospirae bacterium]|nr:tetratricopeptide repeat protein [Nitrospirota bacterium]